MTEGLPRSIDGYPVVKELGRGVSGAVYQVRLPGKQKFAALKLFEGEVTPAEILRFRREFGAISRCRHDGIVAVYGLGELNQHPYILMEFVKGQQLDEYFRQGHRQNEPLSISRLAEFVDSVRQILQTLQYLHSQKIIHRDIKPANIFITDENRIKILDFGLAWHAAGLPSDKSVGTAGYQAPEQILSRGTDPRSDLYSLGITLYEIIAGIHPFGSFSSWQLLLERQLNNRCNRLAIMNPAFGEPWDYLIKKMMAPDPIDRFYSASQALMELSRISEVESGKEIPAIFTEIPDILKTRWIGDRRTINKVIDWMTESMDHHVFFQVPSGGGRTRFIDEVAQLMKMKRNIFLVDCRRDPPQGWLERFLKTSLPSDWLKDSEAGLRVDSFLDHGKSVTDDTPEKARDMFFASLTSLIQERLPESRYMILIDNADDLPEMSTRIIQVLTGSAWIQVVMAGNSVPERLKRNISVKKLESATDNDVIELINNILGTDRAVNEKFAAAVNALAGQRIGTAVQFFQSWIRSGYLRMHDGVPYLVPPAVPKPVSLNQDDAVEWVTKAPIPQRELPEVDRLDREILRTVSACQTHCGFSLLTKLFAARDTLLLEVLDRLIRGGWLLETYDSGEVCYQFDNMRDKMLVYSSMSPFHLRYLHRRIWEAVRKLPRLDHAAVYTHIRLSESPVDSLDEIETIARAARDRFDNDHALTYYQGMGDIVDGVIRDSADVLSGPEDWVVRFGGMSYGMMLEAAKNTRTLNLSGLQHRKIDVYRNRGNIFGRTGDYGAAFDAFQHMLSTARDLGNRQSEGEALRFIGQILFYQRKLDESEKYFKQSLEIRESIQDEAGIADCLNALGVLAQQSQKFDQALGYFTQSLEFKTRLGDERGTVYIRNNIANLYYGEKRLEEALAEFRASCAIFRRLNDDLGLAYCLYNIGGVCIEMEQFAEAVGVLEESLAIRRKMQDLQDAGHCLWQLAAALKGLGRIDEAIQHLLEAAVMLEEVNLTDDAEECRLMIQQWSGTLPEADKNPDN
ncbi:serine/threonine protein kinase [bacterium]|nr:serine/threonine protein kinase [candidate division CSSED10-310 bacterium]